MERIKECDLTKNANGKDDDPKEELTNHSNPRVKTSQTKRGAEKNCSSQLLNYSKVSINPKQRNILVRYTNKSLSQWSKVVPPKITQFIEVNATLKNQMKLHSKFVTPFQTKSEQLKAFEKYKQEMLEDSGPQNLPMTVIKNSLHDCYYMKNLWWSMAKDSKEDSTWQIFRDHFSTNFTHLNMIKDKNAMYNPTDQKPVYFLDVLKTKLVHSNLDNSKSLTSAGRPKRLLVLDLDETLVHCKIFL